MFERNHSFSPLHQKLQLIKARENVGQKEAMKILADSGQWFDSSWKKGKENEGENEGFSGDTVEARVRSVDVAQGRVVMCAPAIGLRPFSFDAVLPGTASQSSAYETTTSTLVADFLNGYNAAVICYGQTGSGKTHTCFGEKTPRSRGLVPRACEEVFASLPLRRTAAGITCELSLSYVEIFGDEIFDLLSHGSSRVSHSKVAAQSVRARGRAESGSAALRMFRIF